MKQLIVTQTMKVSVELLSQLNSKTDGKSACERGITWLKLYL